MKKTSFGKNLEFLRKKAGLNQAQMADSIGFKRTTWAGYESNKSLPKVEDLMTISEYFGISESELLHIDISDVGFSPYLSARKKQQISRVLSRDLSRDMTRIRGDTGPPDSQAASPTENSGQEVGAEALSEVLDELRKLRQDVDLLKKDLATQRSAVAGA